MAREHAVDSERGGPLTDFYRSAITKLAGADTAENRATFALATRLNGKSERMAQADLDLVRRLNRELDGAPNARAWHSIRASHLQRYPNLFEPDLGGTRNTREMTARGGMTYVTKGGRR